MLAFEKRNQLEFVEKLFGRVGSGVDFQSAELCQARVYCGGLEIHPTTNPISYLINRLNL